MISRIFAEKALFDVGEMDLLPSADERILAFFVCARPACEGTLSGFDDRGGAEKVLLHCGWAEVADRLAESFPGLPREPDGAISCRREEELVEVLRTMRRVAVGLPKDFEEEHEDEAFAPAIGETEAEALVKERRGQAVYRRRLEALWQGRCAVTGIGLAPLLRASHAKPWAECTTGAERLSPYNGLLLTANLDALFDTFLIAFEDSGEMLVSDIVSREDRTLLGLDRPIRIKLTEKHLPFIRWHRERFRATGGIRK